MVFLWIHLYLQIGSVQSQTQPRCQQQLQNHLPPPLQGTLEHPVLKTIAKCLAFRYYSNCESTLDIMACTYWILSFKKWFSLQVWRTYLVANEWNELQTTRKINLSLQIILVILVLRVILSKYFDKLGYFMTGRMLDTIYINKTKCHLTHGKLFFCSFNKKRYLEWST